MHVDDLADAIFFITQHWNEPGFINISSGEETSILNLAKTIQRVVGFKGIIEHDLKKPDGTPRKLMHDAKLKALGWESKISLEQGIEKVYQEVKGKF